MDYELAKKLKDAGFPQHERLGIGHGDIFIDGKYGLMYVPTLSELIDACGKGLGYLAPFRDLDGKIVSWGAKNFYGETQFVEHHGSTPSEAVANLWLAINNK